MTLLDELRQTLQAQTSPFAIQLLKEDITRLEKLAALKDKNLEFGEFKKHAKMLGWTQGDLRTLELDPELSTFLDAAFHQDNSEDLRSPWLNLNRRRMDLLIGCLSRPRID